MRLLRGSRPDWPALARRFHSRARSPLRALCGSVCPGSTIVEPAAPCTLLPLCGASDSIREEGCKRERRQDCGVGRHPRDDLSATPGARGRHLCKSLTKSEVPQVGGQPAPTCPQPLSPPAAAHQAIPNAYDQYLKSKRCLV